MLSIFDFDDYKNYVNELVQDMPRKGYGQFRRMAEVLGVNSVIITQIFKGSRELSTEHSYELAQYFGLSNLETKYLLLLVQKNRAGSHKLKNHFLNELKDLKTQSKDLKNRVPQDRILTEEAKAQFYSNWYYSGIRLLSSIPGFQNIDEISDHLKLPRARVKQVSDFLIRHHLMTDVRGKLGIGPKLTHLESSSPYLNRHHSNWRLKALQNIDKRGPDDLFYSAPMVLSEEAKIWVQAELVKLIQRVLTEIESSKNETLACLNIDWFDFRTS